MDEGTSAIRQEIEETRARVGDEVEALSYKTDVGARLDDYVGEKKQAVTSKLRGAKDAVVPSAIDRNPIGLLVGGAAVGFVLGMLLPSTRLEDEHMGEMADRFKETAQEAGHEALDRGKAVAHSAAETAKEETRQQGSELASDLKERVSSDDPRTEPIPT